MANLLDINITHVKEFVEWSFHRKSPFTV